MIEGDCFGSDSPFQHGVQVAAVDMDIRTTMALLARLVEHDLVHRLAGVPSATDVVMRFDAGRDESALEAKTAEHLGRIGAEDDARANPGEGGRLLVDFHCE